MKKLKKIIVLIMAIVMVVSSVPLESVATEAEQEVPAVEENLEIEENTEDAEIAPEAEEFLAEETEVEAEELLKEETEAEAEETLEKETISEEEIIVEEEIEKENEIIEEISQVSKAATFAADTSNILDAAIFGSDVYGETETLESVFFGVASSGVDYSTVTFAGDTFAGDAGVSETITSLVQNTLNDTELECIYTYGGDDSESDIEDQTGLMYAGEYYVYGISQTDMEDVDNAYTKAVEFLTAMSECDKTKPLFIVSHMPLHESKVDNLGAYMWFAAISEVAKAMDVVFFWGHNAAEESETDIDAYYVEKNGEETFKVEGGDNVTPNFTYMNAGYIGANSENPARLGVVTAAWIYEDKMVFQDCNSEGPYTGEYAHNVTVEREFEELTVNTVSCQDDWETIDITATALGIQDISAQYIYGEPDLSDLFTDYVSYQVDLVGYVEGTEVTYTMSLVEAMDTHNLKVIHVDDSGEIEEVEFTFEDDIFTFTTDKDGIFAYGPAIVHVPEDAVLTNLQITNLPTTTKYFRIENSEDEDEDEYTLPLNIADLEVVAEYSNGTDTISKELEWDRFDEFADGYSVTVDMTKIGAQNVVITYTYGDVTLTDAYRIVICHQYIEDKDSKVKLEFAVPGVTDVKILEDVKDEKLQTALEGLLTNYVAYDFEFEGYNEGESVSVTLPIPEGVNVPAVYHVADRTYYATAVKDIINNGDGTITFTANKFSEYVVGEETVIEVPNPTTADVTGVQITVDKIEYVLVKQPTAGKQYIIASSNRDGSAYVLKENTTAGSPITINKSGNGNNAKYYIETTDKTILWNATAGMKFQSESGKYYLRRNDDGNLSFDKTNSTNWKIEDNGIYYLYYYYYRHYLKFSSGYNNNNRWSLDWNDNNIYFYEKQMIPTTTTTNGTYSITGNPATISKTVVNGTSVTLGSTLTFTPESGTVVITDTSATATYTPVGNGDPNGIISGISGNTVTFTGRQGKALVRVSYVLDNGKVVDNYIQVEAQLPHYVVDVVDNGEIVTRNTIVVKSVTNGTTYELDNQVTYETEAGKQTITPGAGTISWQSSNPTVATVDENGTVSFTGVDGTTTITVMYKVDEHTYVVGTVNFSATQSQYTIPDDGTSDFPEYPNEGAVRFDKTATAVGNFNQTGIAQVELSMTGVPYSGAVDVVLLLDMSQSMADNDMTGGKTRLQAVKEAAEVFITTLVKNEETGEFNDNRISVVVFNGAENDRIINITTEGLVSIPDQATLTNITGTINRTNANGGTYYSAALAEAQRQLQAAKNVENYNRKQFVVFMSDGQPDSYDNATDKAYAYTDTNGVTYQYAKLIADKKVFPEENYSTLMKADDVTIYTVGLGISANNDYGKEISKEDSIEILNRISSDYTDEKYAILVEDSDGVDKLKEDFNSIASSIKFAAENVEVVDKITDKFTMIFELPSGVNKDEVGQEAFYIEVVDYPLKADHTRDTANMERLMKLYVAKDGSGNLYAASDENGTGFTVPVYEAKDADGKGYYNYDAAARTVTFVADGSGTHNMVSGAFVTGTSEENLKIYTPYFYYDASTRILQWVTARLSNRELALRYFLYLEDSAGTDVGEQIEAGTYKTNEYATLTYNNFLGNECQQIFPVPQVTWNGAQVSYVFYLVNENGDPVNRAGRIVPFSEAVYVTDVFTHSIVWNDLQKTESLEAEFLAQGLLPDVYELYDPGAKYNIHVFEDENAANLNNHFVIGTDSANNNLKETTYVFNTKSDTDKYSALGTYAANKSYFCKDYDVTFENNEYKYHGKLEQFIKNGAPVYGNDEGDYYTIVKRNDAKAVGTGFDFSNTTVAFAVEWVPSLSEDTVVIDYGLPVVINVSENDGLASGVVGVRNTKPVGIEMNTGQYTTGKKQTVDLSHGTASVENMTSVRYTPKDMQMDKPEVFYYESDVNYYTYDAKDNAILNTAGMYSSVTVVPATTVYYEDTEVFVKYNDSTTGTYGKWSVAGTENKTATQDPDRPGADKISAALDADNVYGYDSNYTSCDTYSLGSAHKVTVSSAEASSWPTAEFTFTGTAFDIISLTSNTTGTITVNVVGKNTGYSKMWFVDTYYGYECTKNEENPYIKYTFIYGTDQKWHVLKKEEMADMNVAEGENILVPAGDNLKPGAQFVTFEENVTWTATTGTDNSLYQIPVIKSPELNYDTYTVTIMPRYANAFNHTSESHYDFYLDAIRIYNSAKNSNVANEVYVKDNEGYPEFIEIRKNLLEQKDFDTTGDTVEGAVFIDGLNTSGTIADYSSYGPNNEVYLKKGQAVAFVLDVKDAAKYAATHIGMKAPQGGTASVNIAALNGKSCTIETNSATELYYDITECVELSNGTSKIIVITNTSQSEVLLSLTNLKITYKFAPTKNTMIKMIVSEVEEVTNFVTANYVALVPEESVEKDDEPVDKEPVDKEPEKEEPEDVVDKEPEKEEPEDVVDKNPIKDKEPVDEQNKKEEQNVIEESAGDKVANYLNGKEKDQVAENTLSKEKVSAEKDIKPEQDDLDKSEDKSELKEELPDSDEEDVRKDIVNEANKSNVLVMISGLGVVLILTLLVILLRRKEK